MLGSFSTSVVIGGVTRMKQRVLRFFPAVTLCGALVLLAGCFLVPNDPPVAAFTATPSEGNAPLSVAFDASGSYDPDGVVRSYRWLFGDGTTGAGMFVTHVYAAPGTYTVRLTVEDRREASSAATATIVARVGTNYAIIIGIAAYARISQLDYTDDDAESVAQRLASLPGWDPENMVLLLNSQATSANFTRLLDALQEGTEDDVLFVFYSGHGNRVEDTNGDEADGYDEVLCFYDVDIRDDTFALLLESLPMRRMAIMMDACYSGGQLNTLDVRNSGMGAEDGFLEDLARIPTARPQDLDRLGKALVALSASRFDEVSWEFASLGHGLFAYALLEALDGRADAAGDRDGTTSAEECFAYIGPRVRFLAMTGAVTQNPQMLDLCPGELELAGVP
jgi:PKD repeat protein